MDISFPHSGIHYFKYAKEEAQKSTFRFKVGACLVLGKRIIRGYNKKKTHPIFANPNLHIKHSIHAELDCLSKLGSVSGGTIYVYRETRDGNPAISRPCEHCMTFLKEAGIKTIFYSIAEFPFWRKEVI